MSIQTVLKSSFQYEIVKQAKVNKKSSQIGSAPAEVYFLGSGLSTKRQAVYKKTIEELAPAEQKSALLKNEKRTVSFVSQQQTVWILQNADAPKSKANHHNLLSESTYAWFRDHAGSLLSQFKVHKPNHVRLVFIDCTEEIVRAALVGLEMAAYNFLSAFKNNMSMLPKLSLEVRGLVFKAENLNRILAEAQAVQLARHLVNLPPNHINPQTVEDLIKKDLSFSRNSKIEIWDEKKLAAENMNLLLAVGQGSETPPRMVRISYRPKNKNTKGKKNQKLKKPIAFVGKGITFDTGGLDIKPSSAMRLMKKDMGGAAAVLALAYWADRSSCTVPCDFYLALAENAVDAKAMRPGDLYTSRAGHLVEIDNTDAEGRLVLADVMDVAVTQKGDAEPEILVDVATLTGAIKVALGAEVAGLFCNDDELALQIQKAGQRAGDLNWRMPLVSQYFSSLSSNFADFKNSADGFGGAITAALFLEKFCGGKKWAHLDVYSWNDKTTGALGFAGGSGQPVQALIEWLKGRG